MSHAERHWLVGVGGPSASWVGARLRRALASVGLQDWMLEIHLLVLLACVLHGSGPTKPLALGLLCSTSSLWLAAVGAVRLARNAGPARSALYRLGLIAATLTTYLGLRWVLPVAAPHDLDAKLLAFDLRVFGYEPALAWDALVTPGRTEWFAFFYYSYFFVLGAYAIPIALTFPDEPALREFSLGLLFLFCTAHLLYAVVPAVGPHAHVASPHALTGTFFWPLVERTVNAAGAGKDVFPSLHSAVPVFLTLYSIRHRKQPALRRSIPLIGFVSSQTVLATMYLRWHYLIDVLVGIALAIIAIPLSARLATWEVRRRSAHHVGPLFPAPPMLRRRNTFDR